MVDGKKLGLVGKLILGAGAFGGLVGGCNEALVKEFSYLGAQQAIVSGIQNGVEGPRGTTVNVERGSNTYNNPSVGDRELCVWVYEDKNRNGKPDKDEILGDVSGHVNLDRFGLITFLRGTNSDTNYSIWGLSGDLVGSTTGVNNHYYYTARGIFSGDFMDNLNGSPDGEYKFVAHNNGKTFSKNVIIFRDEPNNTSNK